MRAHLPPKLIWDAVILVTRQLGADIGVWLTLAVLEKAKRDGWHAALVGVQKEPTPND